MIWETNKKKKNTTHTKMPIIFSIANHLDLSALFRKYSFRKNKDTECFNTNRAVWNIKCKMLKKKNSWLFAVVYKRGISYNRTLNNIRTGVE